MQIHDKISYLVITFSLLEMFELHVFHKAWSLKLYAVYSDNKMVECSAKNNLRSEQTSSCLEV